MTKLITRRQMARQALIGAGVLLISTQPSPAASQTVDPLPAVPPPLPSPAQKNLHPMSNLPLNEGDLLTQLVPVAAGYPLSETQAKETALQLKDYPGGFAKARAYPLSDDIGPAFAADAPVRKERVK